MFRTAGTLAGQILGLDPGLALRPDVIVEEDIPADDLAGREVAVLDPLRDAVFVYRLAEVADVIGGDLGVGPSLGGALGELDLPRGGGEADLDRLGVAGEDLRPLAPGRAVALVDDDVAEVVLRIMGREEVGVGVIRGDVQCLVGGNEDVGGLLGVAARHWRGVGAEHVLEGSEALGAQLVPVAHEESAAQLPGIGDLLEQMDGDEGFA